MNTMLKQNYKANFSIMQELVNKFDPCGLIEGGAPIDEYDCLTEKILIAVQHKKESKEIGDLIIFEIEHHFGTPDLKVLAEPYKTQFYNSLSGLLTEIEIHFKRNDANN
jgi:hypothetical protein